jgi:hypothetical protein
MQCHACQELVQRRLDGEEIVPAEQADAEQHLHGCAACRALTAASRRLAAGLARLTPPGPPAGLAARVLAAYHAARRARRRARLGWAAVGALAASLLVALAVRFWPAPPAPEQPPPVASGPKDRPPPPADRPDLRKSVETAGEALAALTTKTAEAAAGQTKRLLPAFTPPLGPLALDPALEPPARSLAEAAHGVGAGLGPVTGSARRAVDLFLRDLPPMGLEEKNF